MKKYINNIVVGGNMPTKINPIAKPVKKHKPIQHVNVQQENIDECDFYFNDDCEHTIIGICDEIDDFVINVNVFIDEKITYKQFIAHVKDNMFECEIDIEPTCLDYMFVQNIDEYLNDIENVEPVTPDIISILHMCSTKYINDKTKMFIGTTL